MLSRCLFVCVLLVLYLLVQGDQGVSAKFVNLTNRKLRVFWVNYEGQPYLNAVVPAHSETSFTSYAGHKFFWAEMTGPEVPLRSKGSKSEQVNLVVDEDFLVYPVSDHTTSKEAMDAHVREVKFMTDYRERTGRHWINMYPRDPPIFAMYPAKNVGDTYPMKLDETTKKWLCEDASQSSCRGEEETLQIRVVATQPRAFLVENFISDWEADYVVNHHGPLMTRSTTGNGENIREETVRTSLSHRMNRDSYPLAESIYRRLALALNMSHQLIDHHYTAEPINIVYYQKGQEYTPHFDTGSDGETQESRFVSALLYFSTPEAGGHTSFPKAAPLEGSDVKYLRLPAKKGNMMFFYNLLEDGNIDEYSLHAGEPVEAGEKWIGAAWIWEPRRAGDIEEIKKIYKEFQAGKESTRFQTEL